nr:Os02g0215400 [Ipomoea batatas]
MAHGTDSIENKKFEGCSNWRILLLEFGQSKNCHIRRGNSSIVASDTRPIRANVVKISNRPRMKNISIEIKGVLPFEKCSSLISCLRNQSERYLIEVIFPRHCGIGPPKILKDKSRSSRERRLQSALGIFPCPVIDPSERYLSEVIFPRHCGTGPSKTLKDNSRSSRKRRLQSALGIFPCPVIDRSERYLSEVIFPRHCGIGPPKILKPKPRFTRERRLQSVLGIFPCPLSDQSERCLIEVIFPRHCGIGPPKILKDKSRSSRERRLQSALGIFPCPVIPAEMKDISKVRTYIERTNPSREKKVAKWHCGEPAFEPLWNKTLKDKI